MLDKFIDLPQQIPIDGKHRVRIEYQNLHRRLASNREKPTSCKKCLNDEVKLYDYAIALRQNQTSRMLFKFERSRLLEDFIFHLFFVQSFRPLKTDKRC
jgi:hypothetical protein